MFMIFVFFNGDPTDGPSNALQRYLSNVEVAKYFHGKAPWVSCNGTTGFKLSSDIERSTLYLFPQILSNVKVLLYNGGKDLICNYWGTGWWSDTVQWAGANSFSQAQNVTWSVNGAVAGWYKAAGNLTRLIVNNAGHMSPYSQPMNVQSMLYSYIAGEFNSTLFI